MSDFQEIKDRATAIRDKYKSVEIKANSNPWTYYERTQGMVADAGDFLKLVMMKKGLRKNEFGDDLDKKLGHELSDILWCALIISDELGIDIEKSFLESMESLEARIDK